MARTLLIDGKLPMKIFVDNGYRYAVTRTSVRKPNGKYNHPQKIWGSVDEELNFYPNARYLALSEEERNGILIPAEWKLQPAGAKEDIDRSCRGRLPCSGESSPLLYGHTWFLDMLADKSGLRDDLVHVFEDRNKADAVLSLAYFSLLGCGSFDHFASEQRITWFPADSPMDADDVTRLVDSIGEDDKRTLARCRKARTKKASWLGIVSTGGAHRCNVLALYDISDGVPVCYRKMSGGMPDTRSMRALLDELKDNDFGNVKLVLDRMYVSEEVLSMLVRAKHPFVMMTETGDARIADAIREADYGEMTDHSHWINEHGVFGKVLDCGIEVTGGRVRDAVKACLFLDPEYYGENRKGIHRIVSEMAVQLENMKQDGEAVDANTLARCSRYFDIVLTKDRKIGSYAINRKNIKAEADKIGYFAVLTNCLPPFRHGLAEILDICGMREEQENRFMFVKSEQDGRRMRTSKDGNADGMLFVQFVAHVLDCIIRRGFLASRELQELFPTRQHMLEELRSIRLIRHPFKAKTVANMVGSQVDAFKAFKLPVPLKLLPRERREEFADAPTQRR